MYFDLEENGEFIEAYAGKIWSLAGLTGTFPVCPVAVEDGTGIKYLPFEMFTPLSACPINLKAISSRQMLFNWSVAYFIRIFRGKRAQQI